MTNITFNLDNRIISFIKSYSSEKNISQKDLVENAIKKLQIEKMRENIRKESQDLWSKNSEEFLLLSDS